jgi:5'-AMP-activated protein kinase catalytic alpha subunit
LQCCHKVMGRANGEGRDADFPAHFEKGATLGSGFSGQVWAARDLSRGGRLVAIKVLSKSLYEAHDLSYPPLEPAIAKQLSHENVVRFFDVLHEPERIFLVQECLTGGDLFACMQEAGVFSEFLARCCFGDILAGIEYIHARGIVDCAQGSETRKLCS